MQTIFSLQDNAIFYHQLLPRGLLYFQAFHHILTYMHVLFPQYYEVHIKHQEQLVYYLIQTFSNLFYVMGNLFLSNYTVQ